MSARRANSPAAVTSFDVAAAAGVSQSTVSRALRDDPSIAADTRSRVRSAALDLGYVLSERGRSLSTRSTRSVAMVADLDNPLWPALVAGIHDELRERGYRMTLVAERGDHVADNSLLLDGSVDGAILTTARLHSPIAAALLAHRVPFVFLNRVADDVEADAAVADNETGAALAAQLLVDCGYSRFAALLGPIDTSTGRDREIGFRRVLDRAGIGIPSKRVVYGDFAMSHGREAFPLLMTGRFQPDALLCANDIIAVGAMQAAMQAGVRIPEDLAVVGFDDLEVASWPQVRLTTVHVPFKDMVRSAVGMLLARLNGAEGPPQRKSYATTIVLRGTHAVAL